jgi:hypothetical protein
MEPEYIKISQLDTASSFGTSDAFVIVQNDQTLKISGIDLISSLTTLTNLATRSFVTAIVDSAPETLDTLKELAAALNDDANFASTITNVIANKLDTSNFGLKFWEELEQVNTYHIVEGSNLYWTQERFDTAFASKNTFQLEEGSNLYFTEQRVLDVINSLPPDPADRLINGEKEVVLQSNGYIRLVNGAQLYDYGSGTGNGYGITDAANSTYIGYDPSDTLGALHMDSYSGGNIRIRTTTLPNTYNDWLFSADGKLTLPAEPTSDSHAATKGYVDSQFNSFESFSGSYNDLTDKPTAPTYTSVTTTNLNVQNVNFTGTGAVTITSGNDLNFMAAGNITFNGNTAITKTQLKSIVAASADFADFKARIAAL